MGERFFEQNTMRHNKNELWEAIVTWIKPLNPTPSYGNDSNQTYI